MTTKQDIQRAVRSLTPEELAAFRQWFAEFDAEQWDRQIEADVKSGKLKQLIDDAKRDGREGRCTDL